MKMKINEEIDQQERVNENLYKKILKKLDGMFDKLTVESSELKEIRNTIIHYFGKNKETNKQGWFIEEKDSTCDMMVDIVNKFIDEIRGLEKTIKTNEKEKENNGS